MRLILKVFSCSNTITKIAQNFGLAFFCQGCYLKYFITICVLTSFILHHYIVIVTTIVICSKYFCFIGYWLDTKQSDRQPKPDDREQFAQLVRADYRELNWYSFRDDDAKTRKCASLEYWELFQFSIVS